MDEKQFNNNFLIRVAGFPYSTLESLTFNKTLGLNRNIEELDGKIYEITNLLTDMLYEFNNTIDDADVQKKYLNLKRDIYNRRYKKILKGEYDELPAYIKKELDIWFLLNNKLTQTKEEIIVTFKDEKKENRSKIKNICQSNDFMSSILLSNYDLYKRAVEYIGLESDDLSRKLRNTEISLLNYISRMVYKPSPFAKFAGLGYGSTYDKEQDDFNTEICSYQSIINISFLKFVENRLLESKEYKNISYIVLNTTLCIEDTVVSFISRKIEGNVEKDNKEIAVKIKKTKEIELLIKCFKYSNFITYTDLLNEFEGNFNTVDAEIFMDKLIEIGLLQNFAIKPNQTKDYLNDLIQLTSNARDKQFQILNSFLNELKKIQDTFPLSSIKEQENYLHKIKELIKEIWSLFGISLQIGHDSLIFVDTHYPNVSLSIKAELLGNKQEDFKLIGKFMRLFDDSILQGISLRILFLDNFEQNEEIRLTDFHSMYIKSDKIELWKKVQEDKTYKEIRRLRFKVYDYLETKLKDNVDVIQLDEEWILSLVKEYPSELKDNRKFSYYVQLMDEYGDTYFVLNKLGPGYYRHYSRYINLFSKYDPKYKFIEYVKKKYIMLQREKNIVYTDINAVLGLNINIHENLLRNEITYPRSCPNLGKKQLYVNNIFVSFNEKTNLTYLYANKRENHLEIIPLGFLFPMIAPPLYRFLSYYSKANGVEYSFWSKFIAENIHSNYKCFPRIVYKGIIIDRKTWCLNPEEFNLTSELEGFMENIKLLDRKLIDHEVFIKASTNMDSFKQEYITEDFKAWMEEVMNTKLRKPQYINFENYYHQQMAIKIISKSDHNILIQEVLPNKNNGKYENAVELLIEF